MRREACSLRVGSWRSRRQAPRPRLLGFGGSLSAPLKIQGQRWSLESTGALGHHQICVFKGAEKSRQSESSVRAVRPGFIEAHQGENARRPGSKVGKCITHPSRRGARGHLEVLKRHGAGSRVEVMWGRFFSLRHEDGSGALPQADELSHRPSWPPEKRGLYLRPAF